MLNKLNMTAIKIKAFVDTFVYEFKHRETGAVDIVAIIILIAVAVAVALIFKKQLSALVTNIMGRVNSQAEGALNEIGG